MAKKRRLSPEDQKEIDFIRSFPGIRVLMFGPGRPDKSSPFYDLWKKQNGGA